MLLTNRFTHDARVAREARTLAEMGHDVVVHCLAGDGLPAEETRDGFRVRRHAEPAWIGRRGPLRLVPLVRWYGRYDFLARAAEGDVPNVVHGHDLETLLPASELAGRLGVPHVHDDHELGLEKLGQGIGDWVRGPKRVALELATEFLRRRGRRLESELIPLVGGLVTASPLYARVLHARYGVEPVVLLNTPERSDPAPTPLLRERAGLPPGAHVVLYQGTVTPAGGAEEAVLSTRNYPRGWHLVFLGTTWMRPRLEALARAHELTSRVHFLDPVPPAELPAWTRAATVGLCPIRAVNRGQSLSLANKIFEYLHAGLPVIASDVPGQGALVRELDAGELIPDVSADEIAVAVGRVAAVPERERIEWGERLRRVAHRSYCWEIESEKLRALYRRIV